MGAAATGSAVATQGSHAVQDIHQRADFAPAQLGCSAVELTSQQPTGGSLQQLSPNLLVLVSGDCTGSDRCCFEINPRQWLICADNGGALQSDAANPTCRLPAADGLPKAQAQAQVYEGEAICSHSLLAADNATVGCITFRGRGCTGR